MNTSRQAAFFIGANSLYVGDFTKAAGHLQRAMEELRKVARFNDEFKQKAEEALRKLTERR